MVKAQVKEAIAGFRTTNSTNSPEQTRQHHSSRNGSAPRSSKQSPKAIPCTIDKFERSEAYLSLSEYPLIPPELAATLSSSVGATAP
jgi:hypothetical protein